MGENRCVMCGEIIPEGRMICPICERIEFKQMQKTASYKEGYMTEAIIMIDTIDKVKDFCNLCSKCTEDVSVYSDRYIVSGKSIMALFSLDLTKPLKVEFYGDIPYEVKDGMKKFIIN